MDDKFNEQKDNLIAIKKEISLLQQQVDYLIRNKKPLELLDLDVMMNRTHTIYDLMCGVDINGETVEEPLDEEALPVGLDAIREMFGIEEKAEEKAEEDESLEEDLEEEEVEEDEEIEEKKGEENEVGVEDNENAYFIEEVEDVAEEENVSEDRGFILNFEPVEEQKENASVYTTGDEIEMTIPHLEFPEQDISDETPEEIPVEDEAIDNSIETTETIEETAEEPSEETNEEPSEETNEEPSEKIGEEPSEETIEEEIVEETAEEEIAYEPVVIGNMEEKDDGGFELEIPETLGERLQMEQNPTLADKLQHSTVNSLQSAIGINDKFLFVNELFNGSMEKYNRSIANLDDLKTLNGALIYLNELRIELQWNSSNEAYKKLLELVHLKFGA